jgi:cysteine desulfurase/selenocysteine lyase
MVDYKKHSRQLRRNQTDAEKKIWWHIRNRQINGIKFHRQYVIEPYICDFVARDIDLIVEIDGDQHYENKYDEKRTEFLESEGYKVIRYWNDDVLNNIEGVVDDLMQNIETLTPTLSLKGEGALLNLKKDFPALHQKDFAYLDTASSAQKPQSVIDAMTHVMSDHYANIHRGLYNNSQKTTQAYEDVRVKVQTFINAPSKNEIVYTRNTTEAINLVAQSWGRTYLSAGDEVILTEMEHHANIVPWQMLRDQIGIVLKIIPVLDNGELDYDAYTALLSSKTKFISVVHTSNSLGTINHVDRIIKPARDYNPDIKIMIDGSQAVVHGHTDVQAMDCDFFCFTGHKIYGPSGVGVLWGREDILNAMPPYQGGGDMIETVTFDKTTYQNAPARFEAGTPSIVDVIGLGAAIDYVTNIGMNNIMDHENTLMDKVLDNLEVVNIIARPENVAPVLSFTMDGVHHSDIAMVLNQCGVAVRTGHHCCMPLMKRFGIDGTVRVSFGLYNDMDDVTRFLNGMKKVKKLLS